jgi:hypothetical protein
MKPGHWTTTASRLAEKLLVLKGPASQLAGKKQRTPRCWTARFTPQQVAEASGIRKSTKLASPPIPKVLSWTVLGKAPSHLWPLDFFSKLLSHAV